MNEPWSRVSYRARTSPLVTAAGSIVLTVLPGRSGSHTGEADDAMRQAFGPAGGHPGRPGGLDRERLARQPSRPPAGGQFPRGRTTLRGLHAWGGPTVLAERRSGTEPRIKSPEEVSPGLAEVRVGENESFESALRRFNKKIQQSGILAEARRREHYEKPSVKRKRKEAKRKKVARQQPA